MASAEINAAMISPISADDSSTNEEKFSIKTDIYLIKNRRDEIFGDPRVHVSYKFSSPEEARDFFNELCSGKISICPKV